MGCSDSHFQLFSRLYSQRENIEDPVFVCQQGKKHVPTNQIWLNRLYFQISNSQEKNCLTIDTRDSNEFGPGKFRTRANNAEEQYCYFNRTNTDSRFKRYLAKRDWNIPEKPVFSITEQQNYSLDNNTVEQHKNSRVQNTHQQLTNGRVSETGRFTSTENSDGTRPQTETGGRRTGQLDATESTAALRQRLQLERRTGDNKRPGDGNGSGTGRSRKKPRFLSN